MALSDLFGAALTLLALGLLGFGGYLLAVRLLGWELIRRDRLALAIAALLAATGEAIAIGLLLGGFGLLRIAYALALQTALILVLILPYRRNPPEGGLLAPLAELGRRFQVRCSEHLVLALLTVHAVGSEALRGLIRPPLSWDSLMYHLLLAGTWLRDGNLAPVFGNIPVNYYGYVPANGSIWFWWWMAPSHSELYVNLAALPHWLLLGLATAGVARELGARKHAPFAAFLILLTPTVVRFAATEYVDLFVGSLLLAATFFALRWMRTPVLSFALLAGMGIGLVSGAKVLGVAYSLALIGLVVPLAAGRWKARLPQIAAAALIAFALGSFFYLRNLHLGADPLALVCERTASGKENANVPTIPRKNSVADLPEVMFGQGQLLQAFLGITRPQSLELGVGPQTFVLLLGALSALALPFLFGRALWREGLVVAGQIWGELAFWITVPFARALHVFANVRYLIPGIALSFVVLTVIAERKGLEERWLRLVVWVLAIQALLQLHAEMPIGVRLVLAWFDLVLVLLALSPALRSLAFRRRRALAGIGLFAAWLAVPAFARFRVEDRSRALAKEFTAHMTSARFFATGWAWLDAYAGSSTVAAVGAPNSYFVYPAMGARLQRDVRYVNINARDLRLAHLYPECEPRTDPSPDAWIANLLHQHVAWVYLSRYPQFPFQDEDRWAAARPDLFVLRFQDLTNRIYEFVPNAVPE